MGHVMSVYCSTHQTIRQQIWEGEPERLIPTLSPPTHSLTHTHIYTHHSHAHAHTHTHTHTPHTHHTHTHTHTHTLIADDPSQHIPYMHSCSNTTQYGSRHTSAVPVHTSVPWSSEGDLRDKHTRFLRILPQTTRVCDRMAILGKCFVWNSFHVSSKMLIIKI